MKTKEKISLLQKAIRKTKLKAGLAFRVKYYLAVVHLGYTCKQLSVVVNRSETNLQSNLCRIGVMFKNEDLFANAVLKAANYYNELLHQQKMAA